MGRLDTENKSVITAEEWYLINPQKQKEHFFFLISLDTKPKATGF